ncbi:M57 family metalloprotease [Aquimarina sp. RZ0]|uniref:M57 family metalloprotease n=1 Tax=Aquimarina sp. RZ0 TaxID=2607730 RepID=UPI0011F33E99|nr:M57 family metalloprotease [Aquimarina sp. RZ0]KAA1243866.1 hypothetical protein F0000_19010 [Aquimarina sp. RZ0]
MKNVILTLRLLLTIILVGLFSSCENESFTNTDLDQSSFSKEIQSNLIKAGFDIEDTQLVTTQLPDGSEIKYFSYRDMLIKESEILNVKNSILDIEGTDHTKAFQTHFSVNGNRTYKVAFVDFLTPMQKLACQDLIYKFNEDLKTTIKLEPIFAASTEIEAIERDVTVIDSIERDVTVWWTDLVDSNGSKTAFFGMAEFPDSDGNPGKNVQMNFHFFEQFSRGFLRTMLLHEFGHVFGLRHSDYTTRRSCGGINEETDPLGNDYIPTTDESGNFTKSIMKACFFVGDEIGYFPEDITAMRWLYGYQP